MAGGQLFEQGADLTPDDTFRIASGKVGTETQNHSFATIKTWLLGALSFLKISENLNDLNNKATARTNLDVYSTGSVDTALGLKADKSNVLEKGNTTTYVPTSAYNPATKKYADEGGLRIAQATATKNSAIVNDAETDCKIVYMSGMHHVTGTLTFTTNPGVGITVFTLPTQFPVFAIDWYIAVVDANADEGNELKCVAGTRTIVNYSNVASQDEQGVFSANIPAFITGT